MKNSAAAGGNPSGTYFVCGRKLRLDKDPAELDQSAGGAIESLMRATGGKADPKALQELIRRKLG